MNQYDERYDIRLADYEEIPKVMDFIGKYWRKDHIMSRNPELFKYEYCDGKKVHMIIAIDRNTNMIEAIFGYLSCSYTKGKKYDIWGSIWKVNEQHENMPLLGIELAKRVKDLSGCRYHIGNGADPHTTIPLRKLFFKDKTARMKQFYLLNAEIPHYNIAVIHTKWEHTPDKVKTADIVLLDTFEDFERVFDAADYDSIPFKDNPYFKHRYYGHPFYKYQVFGILGKDGMARSVMVAREIKARASKVLRIVDYHGQHRAFAETGGFFADLLKKNMYEYIDFYEFGMDDSIIRSAGFHNRDDENNIIPNYFEPFCQENIDIWVHYKMDSTTFFKADGDQDRPNMTVVS